MENVGETPTPVAETPKLPSSQLEAAEDHALEPCKRPRAPHFLPYLQTPSIRLKVAPRKPTETELEYFEAGGASDLKQRKF